MNISQRTIDKLALRVYRREGVEAARTAIRAAVNQREDILPAGSFARREVEALLERLATRP